MKKYIKYVLLTLLALALIAEVVWLTRIPHQSNRPITEKQHARDLQQVELLLFNSKPKEALEIMDKYKGIVSIHTEKGREWLDLYIDVYAQLKARKSLLRLYEIYPQSFGDHEDASLLVAESYLRSNKISDYDEIRNHWRSHENKPGRWIVLDADKLHQQGLKKKALELLNSRSFKGEDEARRLIRLSLLNIQDHPEAAWDYLNQALHKDPSNPEIHSYRGKLLEASNSDELAHIEYLRAAKLEPENLFFQDQLAEFYFRQKQYPHALNVWIKNLQDPSIDFIWLKALFWSKIIYPVNVDFSSTESPEGKYQPLIDYLVNLPNNRYWDEKGFQALPENLAYRETQQPIFWLQIIATLKEGDEGKVDQILEYQSFGKKSLNRDLEEALKQIILFRKNGTFQNNYHEYSESNPLYRQFQDLNNGGDKRNIPTEFRKLLLSDYAFVAAFLAAGWHEAALHLHDNRKIPEDLPSWYGYGLTQAYQMNRGNTKALAFAQDQKQTPELNLLIAELLLAQGNLKLGISNLETLAQSSSGVGLKANWLLSLYYVEKGDLAKAKEIILTTTGLSNEIQGREVLARIAFLEGDQNSAENIYRSIINESDEAKSFIARKSFETKDWATAKKLTEYLLRKSPENTLLYENWKKIAEEKKKAK